MWFFKWFGITMGVIILIIIIGALILWWADGLEKDSPKIKFKSFKNFYELNNNRWYLNSDNVVCYTHGNSLSGRSVFHFGLIDFYKYQLWKRGLERDAEDRRKNKITELMVAAVKQDIAAAEKRAQKYQTEAIDILKAIQN